MKENKFRGKRKDNGEWVYGNLIKIHTRSFIFISPDEILDDRSVTDYANIMNEFLLEVIPETVGQFVDLLDKENVEIYEGDICFSRIHNPSEFLVEYIEGGYCMTHPSLKGYPIDINHFYPSTGCMIKVIGNIHDYPYIIKKEDNTDTVKEEN